MKKILVPTDFSESAKPSVEAALAIAAKTNAELYFLQLHPGPAAHTRVPAGGFHDHHHQSDGCGPATAKLDDLVKRAEYRKINAKSVLVMDERQEQIEKHAEAFIVDLLVIGSSCPVDMKRVFFLPRTSLLTRHSPAPVSSADLIVITSHRKREWLPIMLSGIVENFVNHVECPVIGHQ